MGERDVQGRDITSRYNADEDKLCLQHQARGRWEYREVQVDLVRGGHSPLDEGTDVSAGRDGAEDLDASRFPCAEVLGTLRSLSGRTRPDISSRVHEPSRRTAWPCMQHWRELQHLPCYPEGTIDVSIEYRPSVINSDEEASLVVGYWDADWGEELESRKHVTGNPFLANGSPVVEKSELQQPINLSTLKSGWAVMVVVIRHGVFLKGIWLTSIF